MKNIKILESNNEERLMPNNTKHPVYAKLDHLPASNFYPVKVEDLIEYAEVLTHSKFINRADELQKKLQSNSEKIAKMETEKEKHELQSELKNIRQPLRDEFDKNFKHEQDKVTKLEEKIKNAHGSQYDQLTAKLFLTRHASISLIQKNIEFEQYVANSNKDDLKSESEARVLLLHEQELLLQVEIEKGLQEEKAIIEKNLENNLALPQKDTAKLKTYHQQYGQTVGKLVTCRQRICDLQHILPKSTKVIDQQASIQVEEDRFTVSEENLFYNATQSNAGQGAIPKNVSSQKENSKGPAVNRKLKPAPKVYRNLKPSELAVSRFFLPADVQKGDLSNQVRRGYSRGQ